MHLCVTPQLPEVVADSLGLLAFAKEKTEYHKIYTISQLLRSVVITVDCTASKFSSTSANFSRQKYDEAIQNLLVILNKISFQAILDAAFA